MVEHHDSIVPAHSIPSFLDDNDEEVIEGGLDNGEACVNVIAKSRLMKSTVRGEGVGDADDDGRRIGLA